MNYATFQHLCLAFDARMIATLCGNSGQPIENGNSTADYHLAEASARIRGVARVSQRYTDEDLDALATAEDALLRGICVALAAHSLASRRAGEIPDAIAERYKQARADLNALASGEMIFGAVSSASSGGIPGSVNVTTPCSVDSRPATLMSDSPFFTPFIPGQRSAC